MADYNIRLKNKDNDSLYPQTKSTNLLDVKFTPPGANNGDIPIFDGEDWIIQGGYGYVKKDGTIQTIDSRFIPNATLMTVGKERAGQLMIVDNNGNLTTITIDELKALLKE